MAWCALCRARTTLGCPCCKHAFCSVECQHEWHGVEFIGAPVHKRKHSDTTTTVADIDGDSGDDIDDDDSNVEDVNKSDDDATMPEFEDAPTLESGYYVFGTPDPGEKAFLRVHEGNHKILVRRSDNNKFVLLPAHSKLAYYKHATIPNSLFNEKPSDEFEAQIDFDGRHVRWRRSPSEKWNETKKLPKLKAGGYRSFTILGQGFLAHVLVCSAYYGSRPTTTESKARYGVGHAVPVAPNVEPHDAASEVSWLTHTQNMADKKIDGTANTLIKSKQQAIFARRLEAGTPEEEKAHWDGLDIPSERYDDGFTWARFASQYEAAAKLNLDQSGISAVLLGKRVRAGIYTFEFVAVAEPAVNDRILVNSKEDTFLTIDGRLMQRKTMKNGNQVWTEFAIMPRSNGYIYVTATYNSFSGVQFLHRLVFFAFTPQSKIDAKVAKTRARNAEIEILLADESLSKKECKKLEREWNGLEYKDFEIDHVDGNPANNALDNLEMLTKNEHRVKTRGHPIIETETADRSSHIIAAFSSITEAAASANIQQIETFRRRFSDGSASIDYDDGTTRHFHKK